MVGIFILSLIILLLLGMPIGFTLLIVGSTGIIYVQDFNSLESILATVTYESVNGFTYVAIPLFILMAHLISESKIADELFDSVIKWVGHAPGGAGIATVLASAGFGTLSGSSVAATATLSKIAIPQLIKANYSDSFSAGLVATSTGVLAAMIPPSIPLILYGIQTQTSIGKLLIAGILPGILLALLLCIYIIINSYKSDSITQKASLKERFSSLKNIWPAVLLVVIILYVIYTGVGTTTEAAAFGAFGAFLIGLLMRRLNFEKILNTLIHTTQQTAMIFTIILGGKVFAYYITFTRVGNDIINAIEVSGLPNWVILILVILLYTILGMFMDLIGSMLLTLPLIYPLMTGLGYDPLWLGIIIVILLEVGLVTPPVGINLFIASEQSGVSTGKVFIGSLPFVGVILIGLLIIILFPQIALYLPGLM